MLLVILHDNLLQLHSIFNGANIKFLPNFWDLVIITAFFGLYLEMNEVIVLLINFYLQLYFTIYTIKVINNTMISV